MRTSQLRAASKCHLDVVTYTLAWNCVLVGGPILMLGTAIQASLEAATTGKPTLTSDLTTMTSIAGSPIPSRRVRRVLVSTDVSLKYITAVS
jgi:hypothetical protein